MNEEHPLHIVSAWVSENQAVLGQVRVADKSNEITVIPQLIDLIDVKGVLVTIDAMGTQTAIAEKIVERKADYLLAVKDNQPTLKDDIVRTFEAKIPSASSVCHFLPKMVCFWPPAKKINATTCHSTPPRTQCQKFTDLVRLP